MIITAPTHTGWDAVAPADLEWLLTTVKDLATEVERIRRPPGAVRSMALAGTSGPGGTFVISSEQWDELLSVPRRTS
jgi:hypothetical protein